MRRARHFKPTRKLIARLRRRAPRHPAGAESALRHAVARLFLLLNTRIRANVRHVAPGLVIRQRRDAKGDPTLRAALASAHQYGRDLLHSRGFKRAVSLAAARTASAAARQTHAALGKHAPKEYPDLGEHAQALADQITDKVGSLLDDAVDRVDEVVGEWADLDPDRSERAEDIDALDTMIGDDQDKNTGKALAAAALAFGFAFGAMVRTSQEDADVGFYMWLTAKDSRVRPEHSDLDETIASWDDPPLTADKSDNEEDDHPGEDFNCRCVASPLTPEDIDELS